MKLFLKTRFIITVTVTLISCCAIGSGKHKFKKDNIDSVLVAHQWTLVQVTQTAKDTLTDITLLLMPCEKDNYIVYSAGGTYQVLEGLAKCNSGDNNIKVQGTWEYDPLDTLLLERYGSGSKIAKKIIDVSDDVLQIQYMGEGRRLITLTYLSEYGLKKEAGKDLVDNSSDPSQKIMTAIREYLNATDHYNIVTPKELANSSKFMPAQKESIPVVGLLPFLADDKNPDTARFQSLIALAKKHGLDYVVVAQMRYLTSERNDAAFKSVAKFDVHILDINSGTVQTKNFNTEDKAEKKSNSWLKALGAAEKILGAGTVISILSRQRLDNIYKLYFLSNAFSAANYEATAIFGSVNQKERQRNYDSVTSVQTAIAGAMDEVEQFVSEKAPLKIKINRIEGSGKKMVIVIEAGNNIRLKEGEVLKVVKIRNTYSAGKSVVEYAEVGELKITKVADNVLSYCIATDQRDDIKESFKNFPAETLVFTTKQKPAQK